ncbi:MAG: hypothetical protein QXU46_01270 [Candidatus Bathyarchaeia archaeon]
MAITLMSVLIGFLAAQSHIGILKIPTSGVIRTEVHAKSGLVEDIQAAVNEAVAVGALNVIIPEGNFTFAARGSYRVNITVPANGINIFGAGINKTVLAMPVDDTAPNTVMFNVVGISGGKIRISGITFRGRPNRTTSPTGDTALMLQVCKDFRIDHCSFYWMGAYGVSINDHNYQYGHYGGDPNLISCGVVDHCYFYDMYKPVAHSQGRGYGYGVGIAVAAHYLWEYNIYVEPSVIFASIFGKYNRNVYIEDCYFTGCRHAVACSNAGAYVLRYSIIEDSLISEYATTGHPVRTNVFGMLSCEIYNVTVRNTGKNGIPFSGPLIEGGSALIYNNTFQNLYVGIELGSCEDADGTPYHPKGHTREVYIWNNTFLNCLTNISTHSNEGMGGCPAPVLNQDYFLHAPDASMNYVSYAYPHPLTLS